MACSKNGHLPCWEEPIWPSSWPLSVVRNCCCVCFRRYQLWALMAPMELFSMGALGDGVANTTQEFMFFFFSGSFTGDEPCLFDIICFGEMSWVGQKVGHSRHNWILQVDTTRKPCFLASMSIFFLEFTDVYSIACNCIILNLDLNNTWRIIWYSVPCHRVLFQL